MRRESLARGGRQAGLPGTCVAARVTARELTRYASFLDGRLLRQSHQRAAGTLAEVPRQAVVRGLLVHLVYGEWEKRELG